MSRYRLNIGQLRQIKQGIDMLRTISTDRLVRMMGASGMAEVTDAFRSVNVKMLDQYEVDVEEFSSDDVQTVRMILDMIEMNLNSIRAELDGFEAMAARPKYSGTIWEAMPPEGSLTPGREPSTPTARESEEEKDPEEDDFAMSPEEQAELKYLLGKGSAE